MKLGFILEDHAGAQDWLRDVLKEVFPEISVTVANRLTEARDKVSHLQQADLEPDIALIDLSLPDGNGIDFIRDLREAVPECLCIVITIHDDDRHVFPALRAGARGYLLKQQSQSELARRLAGIIVAVGGQAGPGNLCTAGYVKTVYRKLEVSSRAEATREAMRMGMIDS